MNDAPRRPAPSEPFSLLDTLLREPGRFSFDAAIAVLLASPGGDAGRTLGERVRFETASGLRPAMRDVLAVRPDDDRGRFAVRVGFSGLTGPGGVLPRPYTEIVNEEQRRRSPALAAFLDLLSQRAFAQFALAGAKYHPHRVVAVARATAPAGSPPPVDPFAAALLALTGHGLPGDVVRSGLGPGQLLYFAGLFASRPRSADRLTALLAEWLGVAVRIEQFVGGWQVIDPAERSCVGRHFSRLGVDAAAGTRAWDIQARIRIVLGPLDLEAFRALVPGSARLVQLDRVIRTYLDDEAGFAINPVLRADAVPPARLSAVRLGLDGWLPTNGARRVDATDALFTDVSTGRH